MWGLSNHLSPGACSRGHLCFEFPSLRQFLLNRSPGLSFAASKNNQKSRWGKGRQQGWNKLNLSPCLSSMWLFLLSNFAAVNNIMLWNHRVTEYVFNKLSLVHCTRIHIEINNKHILRFATGQAPLIWIYLFVYIATKKPPLTSQPDLNKRCFVMAKAAVLFQIHHRAGHILFLNMYLTWRRDDIKITAQINSKYMWFSTSLIQ